MKFRTFRIKLSRGWSHILYSVSLLVFSMLSANTSAQSEVITKITAAPQSKVVVSGPKPNAGDIIKGRIMDADGPMMMVNVTERDLKDRIVAHAISDIEGNFSFKLVDPANRIQVNYVGYDMAISPFIGNMFEITLVPDSLPNDSTQNNNALAIPLREASTGVVTIDMNEFQSLAYGPPSMFDKNNKQKYNSDDEIDRILKEGLPNIIRDDNYSGIHARAYGPQYPQNGNPLVVLDGNVVKPDSDKLAAINYDNFTRKDMAQLVDIKPRKIKSITCLKDAAATAVWGSRGANGVFEITTRKHYRKMKKAQ